MIQCCPCQKHWLTIVVNFWALVFVLIRTTSSFHVIHPFVNIQPSMLILRICWLSLISDDEKTLEYLNANSWQFRGAIKNDKEQEHFADVVGDLHPLVFSFLFSKKYCTIYNYRYFRITKCWQMFFRFGFYRALLTKLQQFIWNKRR